MRPAAGGLAVALIVGLVLAQGPPAMARAARVPTANVTAYAANGSVLPADPLLRLDAQIRIVVTGFAPGAMVQVHEPPHDEGRAADDSGTVTLLFTVPHSAANGSYEITFSGDPPRTTSTATATAQSGTDGDDPQTVIVRVPAIGLFPYRIADRGATSTPSASVSGSATSSGGHGSGPPASTGSDLASGLLVAFAALALGVLIVLAGRRPRPAHADSEGLEHPPATE